MACGDSSAKYVRSGWSRCELQIWSVKVVRKRQPFESLLYDSFTMCDWKTPREIWNSYSL